MKKAIIIVILCILVGIIFLNYQNIADFLTGPKLQDGSFVTPDENSSTDEKTNVNIYFGDKQGESVDPEIREITIKDGQTIEESVFYELQKGPVSDDLVATIPDGTILLSIQTKNGLCTIDLSKEFVENHPGGTAGELATIYSIVNTLTDLPGIEKVQFLIEGEKRESYLHAVFDEPFTENDNALNQTSEENPITVSQEIVSLLKDKDIENLFYFIHPEKGVRFSPYSNIDEDNDIVFSKDEFVDAFYDDKEYLWGSYDGTGDPINLTFAEYYDRFVFDVDYTKADKVALNQLIGMGNTIVNIDEVYPNGSFVEFHISSQDPQYNGMDWRSLRLVFEMDNNNWYLVGIVHGEWTI